MDKNIDNLLYSRVPKSEDADTKYIDHYLE